jgi:hypothetical protein
MTVKLQSLGSHKNTQQKGYIYFHNPIRLLDLKVDTFKTGIF